MITCNGTPIYITRSIKDKGENKDKYWLQINRMRMHCGWSYILQVLHRTRQYNKEKYWLQINLMRMHCGWSYLLQVLHRTRQIHQDKIVLVFSFSIILLTLETQHSLKLHYLGQSTHLETSLTSDSLNGHFNVLTWPPYMLETIQPTIKSPPINRTH